MSNSGGRSAGLVNAVVEKAFWQLPVSCIQWLRGTASSDLAKATLTALGLSGQNALSAGAQAPSAAASGSAETEATATTKIGLTEIKVAHE